jgi:hypothetical protein
LIIGPTPTHRVALYVLIQIIIGIQIRALSRKTKDLDLILMLLKPLLDLGPYMNKMLVNNQKDIARDLT